MVASVRMCLLLLSIVIALTVEGHPVSRKVMPSPPWRNKPTTLLYPHRKLSRPWLVKMQEELWKEGPSGDGPDNDIRSSKISSAKYRSYASETAYKTHTPSLEDFISRDEEPFPTVIDTMIEEPSDYAGELVSRTSMPYEGPSSLLNSFIFRPSVPPISPSSIKTPLIEESVESQYAYSSWLDGSSYWTMSTRQAISDKYSDQQVIVTAISATHIYSESEWTFFTNLIPPIDFSKTHSKPPISFITEKILSSTKTANHTEVQPSSATVQMLSLHSDKDQIYFSTDNDILQKSYQSDYFQSFKEFHQSSFKSQIFLSSSNVSVNPTQTYFYSEILSWTPDVPLHTLHNVSYNLNEELFSDLTPSISSYPMVNDSTELNSENFEGNSMVTNSAFMVNSEILYNGNISLYNKTLFQNFLSSNIQTTVTIVENKIDTNRFVMPTLTIRGTSTSIDIHSISFHDTAFSTTHSDDESNFPEIASSFTDLEDNIPVISLWPLDISSVENIISQEDTITFIQEISDSKETPIYQHISESKNRDNYTTIFYPIFSSMHPPFSDNEIIFGKSSSSSDISELEINSTQTNTFSPTFFQSLVRTYIPSIEQTLTTFFHSTVMSDIHSWVNEIETKEPKINISSLLQSNVSSIENISFSVLTNNASPTTSSVINANDISFQLLSTRALTYVNDKSQQEIASTVTSVPQILSTNDGASLEKEPHPTQHGSAEEFIDPSTHHVTVRSLSDDSAIESSDSQLQSYATLTDSDIENKFISTHISSMLVTPLVSSALVTPLDSSENTTLDEKLHSLTGIDNTFSSKVLESTVPLYENSKFTAKENTQYNSFSSQIDKFDSGATIILSSQALSTDYISLTGSDYLISTSLLPIDSSHSLYSTLMNHEEPEGQSFSVGSSVFSTELLPETAYTPDFIEDNISDSLLEVIPSSVMKSIYFESTKELEDSPIVSLNFSTNNFSKSKDVFSLIYSNRTVSQKNEQVSEQLENSVDFGSSITPSKTVPQFSKGSDLKETTSIYSLIKNSFPNETESTNAYLETSLNFEETKIESSMISLHSSDMSESKKSLENSFPLKSSIENVSLLKTPYLETAYPIKTSIFSLKSYPDISEESKLDLSKNYNVTSNETHLSSYLITLTVPWELSKHVLDYSLPRKSIVNNISSYRESPASNNYVTSDTFLHQDISSDSISDISSSEAVSFKSYDYSYETKKSSADSFSPFLSEEKSPSREITSFYNIESSESSYSYLHSSFPLFTTNFITEISSSPVSSTIFIDSSEFFMTLRSSQLQDALETKIYPSETDNFQEFPGFTFTGESNFYLNTPEITPSEPMDVYKESSCSTSSCQMILDKTSTPDLVTFVKEDSYVSYKSEPSSPLVYSSFIDSQKMFENSSSTLNPSLTLQTDKTVDIVYSKMIDYKTIESNFSIIKSEIASTVSELPISKTVSVSKESDYPFDKPEPESLESAYSVRKNESKSIELDYPIKKPVPKSIVSAYSISKTESKSMESQHPIRKPEPQSIESDYPKRPERQSIESDYSTIKPDSQSIQSGYSTRKTEPYSIESGFSIRKLDPKSIESDYFTKKIDPKSIESGYPQFSIHATKSITTNIVLTFLQPQPTISYVPQSSTSVPFSDANQRESSMQLATPANSDTDLSRKWLKESSTPGYDVEMASVLAISSFLGTNSSRTTGTTFENSGISESDWSKTEVSPTPSLDLTLFKDDLYWILSVLEAPMKGHLPENFSHTMETRLANAYSEAFRRRDGKKGPYGPEDKVVVKILSLTNDLLLSQLNIVYVVERGGTLVPASLASEYLNFLRHEQLREFLGLYAILKAKPYRPSELADSRPVPSPIPVVTIVCSILGFLLFVFCCLCVYCRCCRPKQAAEASPISSASGSLQRSLEKHGQHNRKHLFKEMTHQLTTELASRKKQHDSAAPDIYMPEKELLPGKKLPPLPSTLQTETLDKAMKMLKILENKDASTSPIVSKHSDGTDKSDETDGNKQESKRMPKPKKRRKTKESQEKSSEAKVVEDDSTDRKRPVQPLAREKDGGISLPSEMHRKSPDSGTSSRHTSSTLTSASEKLTEEGGSDGSHTELLPPLQDLIAKSKADSEAAAADTQVHLSRVRQRISELLDDAFALAGGRKFYGSLRSKRIEPASDVFPRYASLRSQSAAECSQARHGENNSVDDHQRPISEGGQHLLGTITDDGQLITRPPPKLVWDPDLQNTILDENRPQEVTEAHNRHINFFPFQQQSKLRQISASSTSSLPVLDTLHESHVNINASTSSTTNVLREAASEVYLAHSSKIHPAAIDQYDEIDVVSALREGEPVAALIQAIKDELQRFSGSLPGTNNESSA